MADVYQTKQRVFVLVVSEGFFSLTLMNLYWKSWKVEHTHIRFLIFQGFIDIPSHLMRIGVIHINDRKTLFINMLIIDHSKLINISSILLVTY